MSPKTILVFCAQALLVQTAFSACAGGLRGAGVGCGGYGAGNGCGGYGAGYGYGNNGVASTGGGLPICSTSPVAPTGLSVVSENAYEGQLCAGGNLPFLGGVAIEGVLPTAGTGAVSYGCGEGAIGISNESTSTGILSGQSYAPSASLANQNIAAAGRGAGYGLGGYGQGVYGLGAGLGGCGARAGCGARPSCGCGRAY